jgi:hypothetical protein
MSGAALPPTKQTHCCCAFYLAQVGPGVKSLAEGQLVLPLRPFLGTWRGALVARERELLQLPQDVMPPELLAMSREMCAAYRLLEDYGRLKVRGFVVVVVVRGGGGGFVADEQDWGMISQQVCGDRCRACCGVACGWTANAARYSTVVVTALSGTATAP